MAEQSDKHSCPLNCAGCSELMARADRMRQARSTGGPTYEGARLVLASAYAFALPLVLITGSVILLSGRLGEFGALGVGLASAVVAILPMWLLNKKNAERGTPDAEVKKDASCIPHSESCIPNSNQEELS